MLILALMGYFPGSRLLNVAAPQNGIGVGILLYRGSTRGYPQNRHFQYQRNPLPVAGPARMVRARRAGCGLLAGTEGPRRGISDQRHSRGWLRSHLAWAGIVERCGHPR